MHNKKGLVWLMGIVLLSACASMREPVTPAMSPAGTPLPGRAIVSAEEMTSAERLIVYAESIRWFAPSALDTERASAEMDYRRSPNAFNRIRLAMLLTLRRAPFRDDMRARQLLSQAAKEPGTKNQPVRSLAMLLLQDLDDRWVNDRTVDDERRQRLALQRKLDQLKAVEEEMDRRTPPTVVTPR
jgi:hypothetical protein